jgi:EmrB/QacA subfamily drug resistance transporter
MGQFMVILDVSIVNVALPSIQTSLGFGATDLQWVVNAYALTFGGFLLLGGRAADLFGRRRMLLAGLALFSGASLIGGLSPSPWVLVGARAAQGVGAAVLSPATLTILTATFTGPEVRARALGTWSAVAAVGGVAGNVLGGVLTALSWRWILFINVPIGAALIVLALLWLAAGREGRARLDLAGAATGTLGLAAVVFAIVRSADRGWAAPSAAVPMALGVVMLALFVVVEGRLAGSPMLPPRLFRARSASVGSVLMALIGATSLSMWYFVSLFLQRVWHLGPLDAGLAMTPFAVAIVALAQAAARLTPRLGAKPLVIAGSAMGAAGFAWLAQASPQGAYATDLLGPGLLVSAATGLVFAPTTAAVVASVDRREAGAASGVINAARQVGGALGLAVLGAAAHGPATSAEALASGYDRAFLVAVAVALATALLAFALPVGAARAPAPGTASAWQGRDEA